MTQKIDIWALGVITVEMITQQMPFTTKSKHKQHEMILNAQYELPHTVSEELRDFVSKMLQVDPDKRFSAQQCLEHPWVQNKLQIDTDHIHDKFKKTLVTRIAGHAKENQDYFKREVV